MFRVASKKYLNFLRAMIFLCALTVQVGFCEVSKLDFLGYEPFYVKNIETRSKDATAFLYLFNQTYPTVMRWCSKKLRCDFFVMILESLATTGIAPYVEKFDNKTLAVSYIEGEHLDYREWKDRQNLTKLQESLHRFYRTLEARMEKFQKRKRSLLVTCTRYAKALKDEQQRKLVLSLLEAWRFRYEVDLTQTEQGIVHGDLHTQNIIVSFNRNRVYLVDFGMCGVGYIIEDLARFSALNGLDEETEQWWLSQWVGLGYKVDDYKLFQMIKILFVLQYALLEAQSLTGSQKRSAFFKVCVPDLDDEWVARYRVKKSLSVSEKQDLLTYALREMQKICGDKNK